MASPLFFQTSSSGDDPDLSPDPDIILTMDTCSNDTDIISELWCLQSRFVEALNSGVSAYKAVGDQLKATFDRARRCLVQSHAPAALAQVMAVVARTCLTYTQLEEDSIAMEENLTTSINDVFTRAGLRRRRKRTNRSHKSKAGKNGHVRKSGKKSKRGRKSPVGNPKRRGHTETSKSGSKKSSMLDINGKKCRNVTSPPTDSMKFGPCRDFFLAHLGDPYPTTVQKHQILKQSSPEFTLRSLNLWFVNIRRRSKWMDIFKKHAGSKRDAMRDLVARVEAQVAGRPAPNPLPSGAAPPGCKVDQTVVEEVMAMRAIVDMVSREVYGEGWDQILQIKPWTDDEVRAHEERKKMTRRQARESKVDGEKRKREREEQKLKRQHDREQRKRIEQEAVEAIRAARELHAKLMNKRKRDDEEESEGSLKRRKSKDTDLDENIEPKKRKIKVPKFDDMGNPLTREQRKAIKRAMITAQAEANPLKRKSPEAHDLIHTLNDGPPDSSPSKRRRRDAATFDGFPAAEAATEAEGMTDLTQLFSLEWASPQAQPAQLPAVNQDPAPTGPQPGYGGFALPSDPQPASVPANETPAPEAPRRFSQQLAAFALESGMFDNQNFELFTADTFPGMEVDVHAGNGLSSGTRDMSNNNAFGTGMHNTVNDFGVNAQPPSLHLNTNASATGSMSVSPIQSQLHTPMQQFATPTQHHVPSFEFAPPNDHSHSIHDSNNFGPSNDSSQHSNADSSDMSWISAALEQLPSQHDVARMNNAPQFPGQGNEFGSQVHYPPQYNAQHAPEYDQRPTTAVSDWHEPAQRMPQLQQNTQNSQPRPSYPPSATSTPMPPSQARPLFSQPQNKPAPPSARPAPSQPPQRHRAPGSLWQTPHSQPSQPRYATPGPSTYTQPPVSFPAPHPHSYPSPATPQYSQPQAYTPVQYEERPQERRSDIAPDNAPYGQRYQPEQSLYQEQPQSPPAPQIAAKSLIKEREVEFARAQEALQVQFRKEQEEQLARFMRAQEDLRNQILGSSSGSRSS